MTPRSTAAPRRSAHSSRTPRALARRAVGAPARRPGPSGRGTGAPAQTPPGSCRDQSVVARQRPDLHVDVVALAAPGALQLELRLVRRVGDGQAAGERPAMPARQLTG